MIIEQNIYCSHLILCLQLGLKGLHVPNPEAALGRSVVDDEDVYPGAVTESCQQLGGQQEVLGTGEVAGGPHKQLKHQSLVAGVHPLVDLVHTPAHKVYRA